MAQALSVGRVVLVQDPDSGAVEWGIVVDEGDGRRCSGWGPDGKMHDRGPGRIVLTLHSPSPMDAKSGSQQGRGNKEEDDSKRSKPKPAAMPPSGMQAIKKKKVAVCGVG